MLGIRTSARERALLTVLVNYYYEGEEHFLSFASLSEESGVERRHIRRTVRALARKGLAKYGRGLFNEDGEVCGSGYCCTKLGAELIRR